MSSQRMKIDGITMTQGNSKLGRVLNISLPPPVSCDTSLPCFREKQCYAIRSCYRLYPMVRRAWDDNWATLLRGPHAYFGAIKAGLAKAQPALFRWHVGGDIPDSSPGAGEAYVGGMVNVANAFPETRFWAFTKRYEIIRCCRRKLRAAPNLTVILSAWPGVPLDGRTRRAWPTCWMLDPKNPDPRIPADAIPCNGRCETCLACAGLQPGQSVVITKH